VALVLVAGLGVGGLAGCGGDDDSADQPPPPTRLADPCRLVSATQLRRDLGVEFALRPAGTEPTEAAVEQMSCSWVSVDPEADDSADYLDREVPRFIDVVVRRSETGGEFDGAVFIDELSTDPNAAELPELLASEADATLADAAVSVGSSVFVLKGDVLMTISTDSAASLDELIPEVVQRILRRL
jgi:hypothetical protein